MQTITSPYNRPKSVQTVNIKKSRCLAHYINQINVEIYHTDMEAYIILCGVRTAKNIQNFVHNYCWPGKNVAFCSLLTSVYYYYERPGFYLQNRGALLRNYEALVFPKDILFLLLRSKIIPEQLYYSFNISAVLGWWAKQIGKDIFYYSPSLCQNDKQDGFNFVGEAYDISRGVGQWRSDTG